jgi:hypothetical protein
MWVLTSVELHLTFLKSLFQDSKIVKFCQWVFYTHAFYYLLYIYIYIYVCVCVFYIYIYVLYLHIYTHKTNTSFQGEMKTLRYSSSPSKTGLFSHPSYRVELFPSVYLRDFIFTKTARTAWYSSTIIFVTHKRLIFSLNGHILRDCTHVTQQNKSCKFLKLI